MNKIQKIKLNDTNKLQKELLRLCNKKMAKLHIPYIYETCVLEVWSMSETGHTNVTVIITSEEVRRRKDWEYMKC